MRGQAYSNHLNHRTMSTISRIAMTNSRTRMVPQAHLPVFFWYFSAYLTQILPWWCGHSPTKLIACWPLYFNLFCQAAILAIWLADSALCRYRLTHISIARSFLFLSFFLRVLKLPSPQSISRNPSCYLSWEHDPQPTIKMTPFLWTKTVFFDR